jgi:hypothetical protein
MNAMSERTSGQLDKIGTADELEIAALHLRLSDAHHGCGRGDVAAHTPLMARRPSR